MSDNRRSLINLGILLAVLALAMTAFSTKGFGLFTESPDPLPSDTVPVAAAPIRLPCAEWRELMDAPALGRIDEQPGIPGSFTDTWFTCVAAGYGDDEDRRIAMIRVSAESFDGWATQEYIADRGRTAIEAHCGGAAPIQVAPEEPFSASCTARADKSSGVAGWSNVKGLISVTVEIHYYDPDFLKTLATTQSTTPDALLAATAAQVGQAVLARL